MTADHSSQDDRPTGLVDVFRKAAETDNHDGALAELDRYSGSHIELYVAKTATSRFLAHLHTDCRSIFQSFGFDARLHGAGQATQSLDFYWTLPPRNLVFSVAEKDLGFDVWFKTHAQKTHLCDLSVNLKDVGGSLSQCFSFVIYLCGELSRRRVFGVRPSSFQGIHQRFVSHAKPS